MLDFAAVDVALGLVFVYLVLSLVCTAINETVSSVLAWRADTLREGIRNLLGSTKAQEDFYNHPLVAGLVRPGRGRRHQDRYPSYIPARVFALAILNPVDEDGPTGRSVEEVIRDFPSVRVQQALTVLWTEAGGNVDRFRASVETWFDESMARVSGWYRRRVQVWLWVWAGGLTLALHADTLEIARTLWTDDATRSVVTARAESAAAAPLDEASVRAAADAVQELDALQIPIGWGSWPPGGWAHDVWVVVVNALGLGLTAVALTLGAPFWFDLLKKVANIRSAGKAPAERQVEKPGEAGEPAAS